MEEFKYYALLLKKILSDSESNVSYYTVCSLLQGLYMPVEQKFLDENTAIEYNKIENSDDEFVVGAIFDKNQLLNHFGAANMEVGKFKFFNLYRKCLCGRRKSSDNEIKIFWQDYVNFAQNILDRGNLVELNVQSKAVKDFEFSSIFTMEEYSQIKISESYEELRQKILEIMNNKESYQEKIDSGNPYILMRDKDIRKALNSKNRNDVIALFDKAYDRELDFMTQLEPTFKITANKITESFKNSYNGIIELKSLNELPQQLEKMEYLYNLLNNFFQKFKDNENIKKYIGTKEIEKYINLLTEFKLTIERLSTIGDVDKIKYHYAAFYITNKEDIVSMAYLLEKLYDFFKAMNEEDNLEVKEKNNLEAEERKDSTGIEKVCRISDKCMMDDNNQKYYFDYDKLHDILTKKLIGRDSQIDRILNCIRHNDNLTEHGKRYFCIIAGPTGTGKTQIFLELKKAFSGKRVVEIVNTNKLTENGYVGGTIEDDILAPLIVQAHNINVANGISKEGGYSKEDIELAEHSIVMLNEIDKRVEKSQHDNVNKSAVINDLLTFMDEGSIYSVKLNKKVYRFDASNLNIFAGGAFQEYFDEKYGNNGIALGFVSNSSIGDDNKTKCFEINPKELINYGLDSQFVGRCKYALLFPPHTKDNLIELESNINTSNLGAELEDLKRLNIDLVWEDELIEQIAERALKEKTGGRALGNIVTRLMGNLSIEVGKRPNQFKTVYIPLSALDDSSKIILLMLDNSYVTLGELEEETLMRNQEIRKTEMIKVNKKALKEALKYINTDKKN